MDIAITNDIWISVSDYENRYILCDTRCRTDKSIKQGHSIADIQSIEEGTSRSSYVKTTQMCASQRYTQCLYRIKKYSHTTITTVKPHWYWW